MMMPKNRRYTIFQVILFVLVAVVGGCSDDVITEDCNAIWTVNRTQLTANHHVNNHELILEVLDAQPGIDIEVLQDGLNEDFLISAEFDAFSAGTGDGGFAQMVVFNPSQTNIGICGASIGSGMIEAFVGFPSSVVDSRFTNGSSGLFTVQRTGNQVTATCKVGEKTATRTAVYSTDNLTISFQIGSTNHTLEGTTAIRILEFTASDSSGVYSDDFECDRVEF